MSCERYESLLIHYVFDVLDPAERGDLESHLKIKGCPSCNAALDKARSQQGFLKKVAKDSFPEVSFQARPDRATTPKQGDRKDRSWKGWLVLCSLAVLMIGSVSGGGYAWYAKREGLRQQERGIALAQSKIGQSHVNLQKQREQTANEIKAIQEQIGKLVDDWNQETAKNRKVFQGQQGQVIITGPRSLQPGAPNEYQIEVKQPAPTPSKANFRVIKAGTKDVLFEKEVEGQNLLKVSLPANLAVKPGEELALEVSAKIGNQKTFEINDTLPLVGAQFLTHLATDRPMYQPGETVYFRSLTLDRFSFKPLEDNVAIEFEILDGRGQSIFKQTGKPQLVHESNKASVIGPDGKPLLGVASGSFALSQDIAGGQYTLHVKDAQNRFPSEKRSFIVNRYQRPRFNKELAFQRQSYGPGEVVSFTAKVSRVEGGALQNAKVTARAIVDGNPVFTNTLPLANDGTLSLTFTLPKTIDKGDGIVSLEFDDGAGPETLVRPLPLVASRLLVDFYPEGGDLIANVPQRVYFQVKTPLGKAADLRGVIVDDKKQIVTRVQTLSDDNEPQANHGMGLFEITPEEGRKYQLRIDTPIGIEGMHALPAVKTTGVALKVPQGVVDQAFDVQVTSHDADRKLLVGAYCRGRMIDHVNVDAKKGEAAKVTLRTSPATAGVYRVTVFEQSGDDLKPLAERLIFRKPIEKLQVGFDNVKKSYRPGESVKVSLKSTDEKGRSIPSTLTVAVIDLSVLKQADEKTFHSLPAHFLFMTEIQKAEDFEFADFMLTDHPKAATALDLLLGTQGWRRFAEQNPTLFVRKQAADAQRLQLAMGQTNKADDLLERELVRIDEQFSPKFIDLQKKLTVHESEENGKPELLAAIQASQQQLQQTQLNVINGRDAMRSFERSLVRICVAGFVLGFLALSVGLIVWGMRRFSKGRSSTAQFVVGGCGLGFLILLCIVGMIALASGRGELFDDIAGGFRDRRFEAKVAMAPAMPVPDMKEAVDIDPNAQLPRDLAVPIAEMAPQAMQVPQAMPMPKMAPQKKDMPPVVAIPPAANEILKKQLGDNVVAPKRPVAKAIEQLQEAQKEVEKLALEDLAPQPQAPPPMPMQMAGKGQFPAGEPGFFPGGPAGWMNQERVFRKNQKFSQLAQARLNRLVHLPIVHEPFIVREYAHQHVAHPEGIRSDFTQTLLWKPAVVLTDGHADVTFDLSDDTTRFQILAFGNTPDGRLGSATTLFASKLPVSLDPKVPFEVTADDQILLPIAVSNDTDAATLAKLTLDVTGLSAPKLTGELSVPPGQPKRLLFALRPTLLKGKAKIRVQGDFPGLGVDKIERTFNVVANGFPAQHSESGMLEGNVKSTFTLPANYVPGTLELKVQAFPSILADLQQGLESMLREPGGCFEQTSSSNYPNVMILNYLNETNQSKPELEQRARALMKSGYGQLTSFECINPDTKKKGYEWFGQTAPPHEALTAYGLLQFKDMARQFPVDEAMLDRTRQYLLGQRDGKGGFKRNSRALDTFGRAPEQITNAYIVWALTETGKDSLDVEIETLTKQAKESKDPYFVALVALGLLNSGHSDDGVELLKSLTNLQKKDGELQGLAVSITGSSHRDLSIETTALAILGWLKANRPDQFLEPTNRAIAWLGKQRSGAGGFGATQATILALKALLTQAQEARKAIQAGKLTVVVNGNAKQSFSQDFTAAVREPITLNLPDNLNLKPGQKTSLDIDVTGNNTFPYTVSWSYRVVRPENPAGCPVQLTTRLDKETAREGETVRVTATVANKSGKGQGMTVAIIGIPAGLALPEDLTQLKDLCRLQDNGTKPGKISAFEIRGRDLVLYWRDLAPDAKLEVTLDLICRLPGVYQGPASRSYLYYNADLKYFVEPLTVTVRE